MAVQDSARLHGAPTPGFDLPILVRNLKRRLANSSCLEKPARKRRVIYPSWDEINSFNPLVDSTLSVHPTRLVLTSDVDKQQSTKNTSPVLCGQPIPCNINLRTHISSLADGICLDSGSSNTQKAYVQRLGQGERVSCKIICQQPCQIDFRRSYHVLRESVHNKKDTKSSFQERRGSQTSWPAISISISFFNSQDYNTILSHLESGTAHRNKVLRDPKSPYHCGAFITETRAPRRKGQHHLCINFADFQRVVQQDEAYSVSMIDQLDYVHYEKTAWSCAVDIDWAVKSYLSSHPGDEQASSQGEANLKTQELGKDSADSDAHQKSDKTIGVKPALDQNNISPTIPIADFTEDEKILSQAKRSDIITGVSTLVPVETPIRNRPTDETGNDLVKVAPFIEEKRDIDFATKDMAKNTKLTPSKTAATKKRSDGQKTQNARPKLSDIREGSIEDLSPNMKKLQAKKSPRKHRRKESESQRPQKVLPKRHGKRYAVPEAPEDVNFFRSFTRRPVDSGEYLSESDNEVDESWLKQLHSRSIDKLAEPSAAEKRFMKLFDLGLFDLQPTGDSSFADYLKEFSSCYRRLLNKDKEISQQFYIKATTLILDGVISHETFQQCLHIIDEKKASPRPLLEEFYGVEAMYEKRDARSGPWMVACICGEQVTSIRDAIICYNNTCPHGEYHLKCVGLTQRPEGWVCDRCKRSRRRRKDA